MAFEKQIPLSYEIQAFAYKNVLRIIKETGCGYDEAWDIFKNEFTKKLTARLESTKEADKRHQQHSDKQKMDGNRNRNKRVCKDHRTQREVCERNDSSEGA